MAVGGHRAERLEVAPARPDERVAGRFENCMGIVKSGMTPPMSETKPGVANSMWRPAVEADCRSNGTVMAVSPETSVWPPTPFSSSKMFAISMNCTLPSAFEKTSSNFQSWTPVSRRLTTTSMLRTQK